MTMQPDVFAPEVYEGELDSIEKRINELELVRATKAQGSWLYQMDTTVIKRLRAKREEILNAISERCA